MWQYVLKRLMAMFFTLIGITLVILMIIHMAPGSPAKRKLSEQGTQEASGENQLSAKSIKRFKQQYNLDKPLFLNFRPFQNYEPLVRFYVQFLAADRNRRKQIVQQAVKNQSHKYSFLTFLDIPNFQTSWEDQEERKILLSKRIKQEVYFSFPEHSRMIVPILMKLLLESKTRFNTRNNDKKFDRSRMRVILNLLDVCAERPFPTSINIDKNQPPSTTRIENIRFLWKLFWQRKQSKYDTISPDRKQNLQNLLERMKDQDSKERVNVIRYQVKQSDVPFFMEKLERTSNSTTIAIASQVLVRKMDETPLILTVDQGASRQEFTYPVAIWNRWWKQNRKQYEFTVFSRIGHMLYQTQYGLYLSNIFQLNFGQTMSQPPEPVIDEITRAAWTTGPLVFLSGILLYLFAIPLGILCAVYQRQFIDRGITLGLFLLYSIPSYVAALVLMALFANPSMPDWLYMFPTSGLPSFRKIFQFSPFQFQFYQMLGNYFYHAALPLLCLSVLPMASLAMYSRTSMLEVIRKDYVRTARAKGVSGPIVVLKHVARNGLNPLITLFANLFPRVVGGSLFIEFLFGIDGVGQLFLDASLDRDYNLLMGILLITAILTLLGILISDLLQVVADPRIRFDEAE